MNDLIEKVLTWGQERGLHDTTDLRGQLTKLTEELGEVAAGVARKDPTRIIDGVGDMLVVLINFGAVFDKWMEHEGWRRVPGTRSERFLEFCLDHAWYEIASRTGQTVDGIFVKDSPPTDEER